jgi:hypothetical protein
MRSMRLAAITVMLMSGPVSTAYAAPLPFTANLEIRIATFPSVSVSSSGLAQVNGSGAGGHLTSLAIDADAFKASHLEIPLDILGSSIVGMLLTFDSEAGNFSGSGGAGFGGVMPLVGVMKLCTYPSPCSAAVANLNVPLSVGHDATVVATYGPMNLTVVGAPWTTGTAVVGTATLMGGVAPMSNTGATSGTMTLVTPIFISSNFPGLLPSFAVMTLHFVPEPTTLALLGIAVVGLAAFGRTRASQ